MSIIYINPFQFGPSYDADAQDYIDRVIAADVAAGNTSGLEVGVQDAYNDFFVGCKADGNFSALKASCILAGARTRAGSLVPLLSSMPTPTSFGFVDADYDRKTGLVGNGSTKYLDSNRNNNADPQNNKHIAVYASNVSNALQAFMAATIGTIGGQTSITNAVDGNLDMRINAQTPFIGLPISTGSTTFVGGSRASSASFAYRAYGASSTATIASEDPALSNVNLFVFARNDNGTPQLLSPSRLAFYSIGESLDLALLDASVSTLMSDLAAAIP